MKSCEWLILGNLLLAGLANQIVIAQAPVVDAGPPTQNYESMMAEAGKLAKAYARLDANSPEREALRASIQDVLRTAFDIRQHSQQAEIAAARAELDALEKRIAERDQFRDEIIRRKTEDLFSGGNLQWPQDDALPSVTGVARDTIRPGDIVAIYIEGVLPYNPPNSPPTPPPVTKLDSGNVVTGYPIVVTSDGTIHLPLLDPLKIAGLTIREAESAVARAYVDNDILRAEKAHPMMTLVPRSQSVNSILSLPTGESTRAGEAGLGNR